MYARCTAVFKMVPILSDRANIVPITYGTVHARNPPSAQSPSSCPSLETRCSGGAVTCRSCSCRCLCSACSTERPPTPFAWEFVCFVVALSRLVPARLRRRHGASWRLHAGHAPADGGLAVDARRVLGRAASAVPREHARRARMRAALGHMVPAADCGAAQLHLSRAHRRA